jgi:salicylate hydroxylase
MKRVKEVLGRRAKERQMFLAKNGHVLTFPIEGGRTLNIVAMHTSADGKWEHPTWIRKVSKDKMLKDFEKYSATVKNILGVGVPFSVIPSLKD